MRHCPAWLLALSIAWLLPQAGLAQTRIDRAEFAPAAADGGPSAGWRPVSLPDAWDRQQPPRSGEGWYRATFTAQRSAAEAWGLYFARVGNALEVQVNGVQVARLGIGPEPQADFTRQPLYVPLAAGLLHDGENEVRVWLQVLPIRNGGLSTMVVGPDSLVRPLYERRFVPVVWGALMVAGVTVSLGLLALGV